MKQHDHFQEVGTDSSPHTTSYCRGAEVFKNPVLLTAAFILKCVFLFEVSGKTSKLDVSAIDLT